MAKIGVVCLSINNTHLFLIIIIITFHGVNNVDGIGLMPSCDQLPHPEACHTLVDNTLDPLFAGDKSRLVGFREFNINGAMLRVQRANSMASNIHIGNFDQRTRAAWADCLVLAEETIGHLQNSMVSPSSEESQTWLSAAIANQQTCRSGFSDFNLPLPVSSLPLMSSNITELVSNSLAINKATMSITTTNRKLLASEEISGDQFPNWISVADRKLLQSSTVKADIVVAKDGSGNYRTISQAVKAIKSGGSRRFVVYIKAGVYVENVEITKSMTNVMFIGDGKDRTVVTGNRNVQDGSTTFKSATFAVTGKGFIAKDMTFQNTAGPQKHQAVALRSGSDLSVFYRCSFKGYRDTLYVHSQRQFYRECDVYGTVDVIFGDAVAVLQNCNIFVRRPMNGQKNTVVAQGQSDPNENTSISIHNSLVTAASDLKSVQRSIQTFLGRPWKQYSRMVFMKSNLDSLIAPAGWLEWSGSFALNTLYYGEYVNTGAGANTSRRVKWKGFRVITNAADAGRFTVRSFLSGNSWIPATSVPFTSGL